MRLPVGPDPEAGLRPTIPKRRIARIASGKRSARLNLAILLLIHQRTGFGDAALYQFGLNLELLVRTQVNHGLKRQIAG